MNQKIVDYLQQNKEKYSKESLIEQLKNVGHAESEIGDAVDAVYKNGEIPLPQKKITQPINNDVEYAGFGIRVGAFLVDMVILMVVTMPVGVMLSIAGAIAGAYLEGIVYHMVVTMINMGIDILISLAYYVFLTNRYQATLGKMAVGIKVCDESTLQKASFKTIVHREVLNRILTAFTFGLAHLVIISHPKSQGIHDKAAHTVVIHKNKV